MSKTSQREQTAYHMGVKDAAAKKPRATHLRRQYKRWYMQGYNRGIELAHRGTIRVIKNYRMKLKVL